MLDAWSVYAPSSLAHMQYSLFLRRIIDLRCRRRGVSRCPAASYTLAMMQKHQRPCVISSYHVSHTLSRYYHHLVR